MQNTQQNLPFSVNRLSRLTGIDRRTIQKRCTEFGLPAAPWPLVDLLKALLGTPPPPDALDALDARKAEAETRLAELRLSREEGNTLDAAKADVALANRILATRTKLLGLANKLAPRAPYWKNEQDAETEIHRAIEEALEALSRPGWTEEAS